MLNVIHCIIGDVFFKDYLNQQHIRSSPELPKSIKGNVFLNTKSPIKPWNE